MPSWTHHVIELFLSYNFVYTTHHFDHYLSADVLTSCAVYLCASNLKSVCNLVLCLVRENDSEKDSPG